MCYICGTNHSKTTDNIYTTMGFISVILTIILAFYVLGFILRVFMRYKLRQIQKQFEQGSPTGNRSGSSGSARSSSRTEGTVTVEKAPTQSQSKPVNRSVGEYVDFEAVDTHTKSEN